MQFVTLFLLGIINLAGLYAYFASQFTKDQINEHLWSFLEINFEPSQFSPTAIIVFLSAQLLLIILVYMYGAYNRRVYTKMHLFKRKSKTLATEQSEAKKMLQAQSKSLATAKTVEQQHAVLQQSNADLHALLQQQEQQILQLQQVISTANIITEPTRTAKQRLTKQFKKLQQYFTQP
jgi:hypothetical protein